MVREITILGSSGTKGSHGGTSAFYINAENVIDAGNLLQPLGVESAQIETVWLTHSHLDHIMDIAYILDSYFNERKKSLVLRGLPETLEAVRVHLLNDLLWPDFSKIGLTDGAGPSLRYEPLVLGERYRLDEETYIEAYETDHTVASCGYIVTKAEESLLITADTYSLLSTTDMVKRRDDIKTIVVECSFPTKMFALAKVSKHLTPRLLFEGLAPLEAKGIKLYINHIKPRYMKKICSEIAQEKGSWRVEILKDGEKIHF